MSRSKSARGYVNPMEWVGEAHNAAVRHVLGQIKLRKNREPDWERVEQLVVEYFDAVGLKGARTRRFRRPPDPEEVVESIVSKGKVTKAGARYVSALLTTFEKGLPLPRLLGEVERQERAAARALRGRDLLFFQALASIGRHSARLWAPVAEGGEDFGHTGTGVAGKIDWGEAAGVDLICAAFSTPIGGALCSIANLLLQLILKD